MPTERKAFEGREERNSASLTADSGSKSRTSRHSATRWLSRFLFSRVAHRVADLWRSANKEMIIAAQFSSIAEQAKETEEKCRPAKEVPMLNRKRVLRELEFVGERCSHHGLGVVTSAKKKGAALRIEHRPPTPNQSSQRNAMDRPISVFESRSSRG